MQYVVRSPETLVKELDSYVDGSRFKSRNQLINVILADWITRESYPVNPGPFANSIINSPNPQLDFMRNVKRQELLGEEMDRYQEQKADVLDGKWALARTVDELERQAEEKRKREEFKTEIREELKTELLSTLRAELLEKGTTNSEGQDEQRKTEEGEDDS